MASQTQGIQQLLAAEKRAAEKVSEARKRKYFFAFLNLIFFLCEGVVHFFNEVSPILLSSSKISETVILMCVVAHN